MTWPAAVPFDPSVGTASPPVEALLEGPGSRGPIVLLAVGPRARQEGWAASAASALADGFAARGESVILADLSLYAPELHAVLQTTNEEGLTDVFLFGASLEHTTLPVEGRPFRLIPASPFTPDAREVLQHRRWDGVFEALAQHRDKLLVYLPMDVEGAAAFSDRVGHTIVLAEPSELKQIEELLSRRADVIGVLTPAVEGAVSAPSVSAAASTPKKRDEEFEKLRIPRDAARETLIADLRARQRAALMAPPPEMTPLPHEEPPAAAAETTRRSPPRPARPSETPKLARVFELHEPEPRVKRWRSWFTWVALFVFVAAVGGVAWYIWQSRFADTRSPQPITQGRPAESALTGNELAGTASAGTELPYSVAIASYQDLGLAQGRLTQLTEQEPALSFYVGPIEVQGRVFYRIMAGPVADSATAVALRDTLIAKRVKTITSGWDVLITRYAFLIGEYATPEEAEAQRVSTASKGVPTYVVPMTTESGFTTYKLYAGAYTGPGDAEFMRSILSSAGLPDHLVERIGSIRS